MVNKNSKLLWDTVLMQMCYIIMTDRTIFLSYLKSVKIGISAGVMHL